MYYLTEQLPPTLSVDTSRAYYELSAGYVLVWGTRCGTFNVMQIRTQLPTTKQENVVNNAYCSQVID